VALEGVKILKWHFAKFKILRWHNTNFPKIKKENCVQAKYRQIKVRQSTLPHS
jgi:hypothetical protein